MGKPDSQPVYLKIMRAREDKLVHYSINGYRAADKLQAGICRIVEDEVRPVEVGQRLAANASG